MQLGIGELIESIGKAVSDAQQNMEKQSLYSFFDYFDEAAENSNEDSMQLCPKTARVALPSSNDITETTAVEIPLLSLVHHNQVSLDQVSVKMKICLYLDEHSDIKVDMNAPIMNSALSSDNSEERRQSDQLQVHEMELVYRVSDKSEGLSRVVQDITKTI